MGHEKNNFWDAFPFLDFLKKKREKDTSSDQDPTAPHTAKTPQKTAQKRQGSGKARKATPEEQKTLLAYDGDVLTAPNGRIATREDHRSVIAILGNGIVLIGQEDYLAPKVVEIRDRAIKQGVQIIREFHVSPEVIRRVYMAHEKRITASQLINASDNGEKMAKDFFQLVDEVVKRRCTDIHIQAHRVEARVRIRSDGDMVDFRTMQANYAKEFMSAVFYMSDVSDPQYKPLETQEGRISAGNGSVLPDGVESIRLQFNPLPDGGRYMIARILYSDSEEDTNVRDLDSLGYAKRQLKDIQRMREMPFGTMIISGPTGSGKSTTLKQALMALMKEKDYKDNVITIEDPPEYIIPGAAQIPVTNVATEEERKEKFRQTITAALRSDPDVIMIGEIRDSASASLAFQAAMTGHQVWTTLHANNAISILDRLKDQGVGSDKITDYTLMTGLIGQRLMKRLCDHCKTPLRDALDRVNEATLDSLRECVGEEHFDKIYVTNDNGCEHCNKGTAGRTVAAETIIPDMKFMDIVRAGQKHEAVTYWKEELGGITMLEHGVSKILLGEVDPQNVAKKVAPISLLEKERLSQVLDVVEQEKEGREA